MTIRDIKQVVEEMEQSEYSDEAEVTMVCGTDINGAVNIEIQGWFQPAVADEKPVILYS